MAAMLVGARSGAIFTTSGVYLPFVSASLACSVLSVASSEASASSDYRSRNPLVLGELTLTVTYDARAYTARRQVT